MIKVKENRAITACVCEACKRRPYSYLITIGGCQVSVCLECFCELERNIAAAQRSKEEQ